MSYDSTAISADPSAPVPSQRNFVRMLLRDNGTGPETFQDSEIDAYLATCSNVWACAVEMASILIDRISERKAGKSSVSYQMIVKRVPEWRRRAQAYQNANLLGKAYGPADVPNVDLPRV